MCTISTQVSPNQIQVLCLSKLISPISIETTKTLTPSPLPQISYTLDFYLSSYTYYQVFCFAYDFHSLSLIQNDGLICYAFYTINKLPYIVTGLRSRRTFHLSIPVRSTNGFTDSIYRIVPSFRGHAQNFQPTVTFTTVPCLRIIS